MFLLRKPLRLKKQKKTEKRRLRSAARTPPPPPPKQIKKLTVPKPDTRDRSSGKSKFSLTT